jgi:hypothetical protein
MEENKIAYQINNQNYYMEYAIKYAAQPPEMRKAAKEHWTRKHAENILSNRFDLIIFSAQILAAIDTIEAATATE